MKVSPQQSISQSLITEAAGYLRKGELVAFPTETVYGLGADARNIQSLQKLYTLKGRPTNHPVIVHLANVDQIEDWSIDLPDYARVLLQFFCPGPLTIIAKKAPAVSNMVTGGQDTVGLRIPAHPVAQALLKEFGSGVAAPSANRYGRVSATSAAHVRDEFSDQIKCILDGGTCTVGIESTIVDVTGPVPRILRPGMISEKDIVKCLGLANGLKLESTEDNRIRVPGSDKSHYAPQTPLYLMDRQTLIEHLAQNKELSFAILAFDLAAIIKADKGQSVRQYIQAQSEPTAYAKELYANLRRLDNVSASAILVENVPNTGEWLAISDRLKRAATN